MDKYKDILKPTFVEVMPFSNHNKLDYNFEGFEVLKSFNGTNWALMEITSRWPTIETCRISWMLWPYKSQERSQNLSVFL